MKDRMEIVKNQIKLLTEQYTEHHNECLHIQRMLRPLEGELNTFKKNEEVKEVGR